MRLRGPRRWRGRVENQPCADDAGPERLMSEPSTAEQRQHGRSVAESLLSGDFDAVVRDFDPAMASALPRERLIRNWNTCKKQLGEAESANVGVAIATVSVPVVRGKRQIRVDVTFDEQERIAGLYFRWSDERTLLAGVIRAQIIVAALLVALGAAIAVAVGDRQPTWVGTAIAIAVILVLAARLVWSGRRGPRFRR